MRVVVVNHLTLDGVVQGPGRPEEDTRDGFTRGGWAAERGGDPAIGAALGEVMGPGFAWLFGRHSYEGMLSHWNEVGGPFRDGLNQTTKYVAGSAELTWPASVRIGPDVPATVTELRDRPGGNLVVMGSGQLVRSLLPHGLVDELFLMVHPVVLGAGHRLFGPAAAPAAYRLVEATPTESGVLLTRYARE
jgi:dihydrofolate reductase